MPRAGPVRPPKPSISRAVRSGAVPARRASAMPRRALVLLAAVVVLSGCGPSRAARTSLEAGQRAMAARAFRPALTHFRAAVTDAPDYAAAHIARGEAAETLGEFDEALAAYQAAAALAPAHRVPLGSLAERMGQEALALQTLEGADGP